MSKDIQLASRITTSLLNEPLVEVTPLIGKGSVNKVFIVEAVNHKVVARISDRAEALDESTKEAWCIEQAAARGSMEPVLAMWIPLVLLSAMIIWMYHVLAHHPGGQPIGALERAFAQVGKAVRKFLPKVQTA